MPEATLQIHIDNLKCGGCAKSIIKGLGELEGVSEVVLDQDRQVVSMRANESARTSVLAKLHSMGYPEKGRVQGLQAAVAGAKSFVSCAVGRLG